MKNIKFRYWNRNSKKMMEVTTLNFPLPKEVEFDVMQYTGLQDIHDTAIYEGDICKDGNSLLQILWSDHHQWACKVIEGSTLSKGLIFPLWQWDNCNENGNRQLEVIGNVYQNYDLLSARRNNQVCKNLNLNRTCMLDNSKCTYTKGEDNGFTCGSYQVIEQNIRKKAILGV